MQKLKEAYDIKKQLLTRNINELGDIIRETNNMDTINTNPDNTIYIESNCGINFIENSINEGIKKWLPNTEMNMCKMIINILPLSNNSCILKI